MFVRVAAEFWSMSCEQAPTAVVDVDPMTDDGYTIGLCDEHADAAIDWLRAVGHIAEWNEGRPEDFPGCGWQDYWAENPEDVLVEAASDFLDEHRELSVRALGGERDALVELLVLRAQDLAPRPLL